MRCRSQITRVNLRSSIVLVIFVFVLALQGRVAIALPTRTKSKITISQSGTSDMTLTETATVSITASMPTLSRMETVTGTHNETRERTLTVTRSGSQSQSESASSSTSHSLTKLLTNTPTANLTQTPKSQTITKTMSRVITRSSTRSQSLTIYQTISITISTTKTPSLTKEENSQSLTASSAKSSTVTLLASGTRTVIVTHTRTIVPSDTATRKRNSRTPRISATITVTLIPTPTLTTYTKTVLLTPTMTQTLSRSVTSSSVYSTTRSLMETATRSLPQTLTPTSTQQLSMTSSHTVRLSNTTSLISTVTKMPSVTTSETRSSMASVTESFSVTRSISRERSRSRSRSSSYSLSPSPSLTQSRQSPSSSTTGVPSATESVTWTRTGSPTDLPTGSESRSAATPTKTASNVSASFSEYVTSTSTISATDGTVSGEATVTKTFSLSGSSDITLTATRTITPPPTLTLTLTHHVPVDLGNLFSLGLSIFDQDTPDCLRIVIYIGLFPFAGLVFSALYALIMAACFPKVDVDTFSSVKQWRSLLCLHSYFSVLFPCHYHCALHHALMSMIHYNLTTGICAAISLSLRPQSTGSITIALTGIFAAVTPHMARPILTEIMYYYNFDRRDLDRLVYVDLDEDAPDDAVVAVGVSPPQSAPAGEGGEYPQAKSVTQLEELAETVPDVGQMESDMSSFGDVDIAEPEAPIDERAFKALNSFVFHFTDDVGSMRSRGATVSLKSVGITSGRAKTDPSSPSNRLVSGELGDASDALFGGDFTPLHTPRQPANDAVAMDEPGLYPYMPVDAKGLWKFVFLVVCCGPCIALNYILTQRMQARGNGECSDETMTGFLKSLTIALVLDLFVFQQAYLAIVLGLRIIRSKDEKYSFSELHPYSGEMRPLSGPLLREQMQRENAEVRKALDMEQQRRRIEERLDLDDHIEIIAAPDADVPQELELIDDGPHKPAPPRKHPARAAETLVSSEEGDEEDEEEEEGEESETSSSEESVQPQSPPKSIQQYSSYGGNMMMMAAMMHPKSPATPNRTQR